MRSQRVPHLLDDAAKERRVIARAQAMTSRAREWAIEAPAAWALMIGSAIAAV